MRGASVGCIRKNLVYSSCFQGIKSFHQAEKRKAEQMVATIFFAVLVQHIAPPLTPIISVLILRIAGNITVDAALEWLAEETHSILEQAFSVVVGHHIITFISRHRKGKHEE